jgi:SAM-dependent methyltransferase
VDHQLTLSPSSTASACPLCGLASSPQSLQLGEYALYLCGVCSLRFAPQAFGVPVDYDRVYRSAEYDSDQVRTLPSLISRAVAEHPTYRAFFDQVPRAPGARLLDIGCGVGRFGHAAHALGWDVTGIDVSPLAITIGQRFARFPLRVATMEQLIANGDQFDIVTAFEVLEHLSDPLQFLTKAQRLLRPGGQAFFTVPNWNCRTVQSSTRPDWLPPIHLLFFTVSALQRAGELSGLRQVRTGVIWSDPLPHRMLPRVRWLARRVLRRSSEPLGLWLLGRRSA